MTARSARCLGGRRAAVTRRWEMAPVAAAAAARRISLRRNTVMKSIHQRQRQVPLLVAMSNSHV